MDDWNYDMSTAPRGTWRRVERRIGKTVALVQQFDEVYIIACDKTGKVVNLSYWKPFDRRKDGKPVPFEERDPDDGYWTMYAFKETPLAWMPWPAHPRPIP